MNDVHGPVAGPLNCQNQDQVEQAWSKYKEIRELQAAQLVSNLMKVPAPHDAVNHPKHYTSHPSGVECIQITEHFGFNLGNVIKYLWRAEEKGAPIQDLEKARWYLDREIEKRKRSNP
ncbi:DUF3310 domain-containing protein [Paraburkholderia youngii]|uniref:DUF3310 domain-containing protein n=1 Tax=Paraburkholderia youngii TaxID=2782701 RepID=UPI001C375916|nr:DUF3310 domain-containing protein [Paraburkholderia youngii]